MIEIPGDHSVHQNDYSHSVVKRSLLFHAKLMTCHVIESTKQQTPSTPPLPGPPSLHGSLIN